MVKDFRDYGPVPWWAWCGKMEFPVMLRQMEQMKSMGIDEFFIYPSMGLEYPNFLEDSWFEYVAWTIKQAKKLKMHVWIYDDMNWPSGSAMGHLAKRFPQYRCRSICHQTLKLGAGQKYSFNSGCEALRSFIRKNPRSLWERVELVDNQYVNPYPYTIELQVYDVRICNFPSLGVRGILNTWYQGGFCDFLNPKAVRAWMSCIHDKYYEHFKADCGKTLRGFFYDEPYFQPNPAGELPWTDGIVEMFQERYGYDFRDHLPEFYEDLPGSEKFRSDFWTWFVERIGVAFSKTIADWCAERNLQSTGHCVFEELIDQNSRLICCGEPHEVIRHNQIPGMDMLMDPSPFHFPLDMMFIGSLPGVPSECLFTAKQACSTARYANAKRVMCESCGVLNPNVRIGREKYTYSWMAACGVSMMNENSLQYTIKGYGKRCSGNKNFFQPWTKHYGIFADAVRELSRFGTGLLRTEVCVLCPESTIRACTTITADRYPPPEGNIHDAAIGSMENLMRNHIDFEVMFEDVLVASPVKKGALRAPNSAFKVMVIPHAPVLRPGVAKKVREFIHGGGKVLFVERRTERLPDGTRCDFRDVPLIDATAVSDDVRKALSLPYTIETQGEVFSALRDCDGVPTLLLSNQGTSSTEVEVKCGLRGPVAAKVVGEDAEWQYDGGSIHLEEEQVVFLRFGKKVPHKTPTLEWGRFPVGGKTLGGPWAYSLNKPNNALTSFELGLCPDEVARKDARKVPLWLPCTWDGNHDLDFNPEEYPHYWLRGSFLVEDKSVIPDLSLVVERDEVMEVYVNGKKIAGEVEYPLWCPECVKYPIAKAVKKGENSLLILCKTSIFRDRRYRTIFEMNTIEPMVLHGNFATSRGEKVARLFALPKELTLGGLEAQGFPFYAGDVSYHCTLPGGKNAPVLEVPDSGDGAVELWLNGTMLGAKLWKPYRFDLTPAWKTKGVNELTIRLVGTVGNLFPRAYGNRKLALRPLGLLKPVEYR